MKQLPHFRNLLWNLEAQGLGSRHLSLSFECRSAKGAILQYLKVTIEAKICLITHGVSFFVPTSKFGRWVRVISSRLPKKIAYSGEWGAQNNSK